MSRRILLTGSSGQVGWELRRTLAPLGEVIVPDRTACDLEQPDALRALVRDLRPDLIVNPAAYTAVDRAESEPEKAMAINATAPAVLAKEAKKLGAALIHFSTDYVFDGHADRPYSEDDPTGPASVYGRSKLAGEDAVRASGVDHLILRTSWVYGPRGKNFLLTMLRLAGERELLRIVADQHGAPTSSRMIAEASAQLVALTGGHFGERAGTYHLTAAGQTTWHGFTAAILDACAQRWPDAAQPRLEAITTADYPLPAPRPAYSVLSNKKLQNAFGLALPDWREGLDLCMDALH